VTPATDVVRERREISLRSPSLALGVLVLFTLVIGLEWLVRKFSNLS
jgi:hypothetical protein